MKKILLRSAAAVANVIILYVVALGAYLTLAFTKSQPTVEINGNEDSTS